MTRADLNNMLSAADLNEPVDRRVMADALEDGGRYAEADLLRSLSDAQRVDIVFGEVVHVAVKIHLEDSIGAVEYHLDGARLEKVSVGVVGYAMFDHNRVKEWAGLSPAEIEKKIKSKIGYPNRMNGRPDERVFRATCIPIAEAFRR